MGEWTSVEDGLPEEGEEVWIFDDGIVQEGELITTRKDIGITWVGEINNHANPTHWQRKVKPEPPQG